MADSYFKKQREKLKKKKREEKAERKKLRQSEEKTTSEFAYVDIYGNVTDTPPDSNLKEEVDINTINLSPPKHIDSEVDNIKEGLVKFFNADKGFGFISHEGSKDDYFFSEDSLVDKVRDNDKVTFEIASGPKGWIAVNIKLISKK